MNNKEVEGLIAIPGTDLIALLTVRKDFLVHTIPLSLNGKI